MTQALWNAVDQYICEHTVGIDSALQSAVQNSDSAGLPAISVAPNQGKLLAILARSIGAKRILEIGTLGAYSTIWLARALPPEGRVTTLEMDPKHAEIARSNLALAGVQDRVEVRVGLALDLLPVLHSKNERYCFTFIDADKFNIPQYFDWAVKLSRPGALIVIDNVVRNGALIDAQSEDPDVIGVRQLHDALAKESRVTATTLQVVGVKGHDGLTIALVN